MQLERDKAYRQIVEMILQGEVGVDIPLSERKVAETLKISRTPVREALSRLSHEGVVEVRLAKGVFLKRVSKQDLREIYEVRQGLEGMAAYLAAKHGATETLLSYGSQLDKILEQPNGLDIMTIDAIGAKFHISICKAARNKALLETIKPLRLRNALAFGFPSSEGMDEVFKSVVEHRQILEAIIGGKCREARKLMNDHLVRGLNVRVKSFQK